MSKIKLTFEKEHRSQKLKLFLFREGFTEDK